MADSYFDSDKLQTNTTGNEYLRGSQKCEHTTIDICVP